MCGYAISNVNSKSLDVDVEIKWQYCKVILYVGSPSSLSLQFQEES